jgi:hypothetical protein
MSTSKSIVFKYTYATSALKQNTVTVFGETATAFVAGQDYDENVIFKVPAASLSAFILYYNGVVPNGSVGSTELPSLRTQMGGVTNVPAYSNTAQYYLGDIVTYTPPNTTNASCYTLVRTTSVASDPVPTQGTTVVGYTGPVIGQNQFYQAFLQGHPPVNAATGVANKSYWAVSTIASGWTSTVPYYTGDRVVFQGNVYQCISTNGLLDKAVTLLGSFGQGDGVKSYYGYDQSGIRYVLNVLPTNSNFWLYSALPAVPSSSHTFINWAQTDIGGLNSIDGSGGVVMKWDGSRPADLLPTATSGGILGGSGSVTFTFYTDDELNKVNTLLNLYNQNQNSFSLVNANAILAKLPASVIKAQTTGTSLEPDKQLAQLVNAGPRFTSPTNYNTVVQSIFEEAIANDMLYMTEADGKRTKLNQLPIHGYPELLSGLENVKTGSTNAFAQGKASMGVFGVPITTAGTGYLAGGSGNVNLKFAAPDTTGVTATGRASVLSGVLQTVTITNPGSGYTTTIPAPSVDPAFPTTGTVAAFGLPTMTLVGVALTSFGGFYSSNQAVTVAVQNPLTFTGSVAQTLSGAPITYTVTSGTSATIRTTLNSFRLVAPGSGYTSVPDIIVSGSTKIGGSLPTFNAVMGVNQISTRTGQTNIPVTNLPLRVAVTGSTSTTVTAVTFTDPNVVLTVGSSTEFVVGDRVQVTGLALAGNNGIFTITAKATGSITFANAAGGTATGQTGTISKNFATVNPVFYGTIESIPVSAGGSGYLLSDKVTISAPYNGVSPVSATTITSSSTTGSIATATLSAYGSGFYTTPNVVVSPPTVTAAATATIFNGSLRGPTLDTPADAFTVTTGGTGYLNAPYVNISAPPTSTTAIAIPIINSFLGVITDVTIINPGVGYVAAPVITFSAPTSGTTALGEAIIENGSIININITNSGSGYTRANPPSVTIEAPPQSIQAQAVATVSASGVITDIKLVNTVTSFTVSSGSGYTNAPSVSIAVPGSGTTSTTSITAGVTTLAITSYTGSNIVVGDSITLSGMTTGNGTYTVTEATGAPTTTIKFRNTVALTGTGTITKGVRATAQVVMQGTGSSQSVARLIVLNPGSGYVTAPLVTFTGATAGTAATATAVIGLGGVGYTSVPSVGILGSTSFDVVSQVAGTTSPFASTITPATMVAVINNDAIGSVGSLAITNAGAGYTQAPTLRFIASAGRTAQASLSISSGGQVTSIVIIDGGYGYGLATAGGASEPITITVASSGGSGATFGTPVVKYTLDRFAYLTTGSGYTSPPTTVVTHYTGGGAYSATSLSLAPKLSVVSIPTFRGVTSLRVVNGGTGYCQQDALQIKNNVSGSTNLRLGFGASPTGFNAVANIVMGGVIRSVTIGTSTTSDTVAFAANTVTLTVASSATFTVGDTIITSGFASAGNNGKFTIATIPNSTSITFANPLGSAASAQSGVVTRGSGTGYTVGTNVTFSAPASGQGTPANGFIATVGSFGEILTITLTSGGFAYGFTTSGGAYVAESIVVSVSGAGTGALLSVGTTPASITYDIIGFEFQGNSYGEYVTAPVVTVLGTATTVTSGGTDATRSPSYVALGTLSDPVLASTAQVVATLGVVPNPDASKPENANSTAGIGLFASPQLRIDPPPQSTTALADAVVVNNSVNNFTITNGGYGYDFVPKITIAGYGTGATATAVMGVKQVFIASGGKGYAVGNVITVTAPGGSGVTAKVRVTQVDVYGSILNTYISVEGSQYTSMPTVSGVTVSSSSNTVVTPTTAALLYFYLGVVSVTLGSGGSSYSGVPSVVFESPNFTSATATMTAKTARIESLQLVSGGSGYTVNQKCRLLGASAQLAPTFEDYGYLRVTTVSDGAITGFAIGGCVGTVRITNGGSGYSSASPPSVTFTGGGLADGSTDHASATTVVDASGSVTGIVFAVNSTSYGVGYTGVPTVTIAAPTAGVRATAFATLDGGFDYRSGDVLVVEGGTGGQVSVVNVSSTIADSRDVAITAGGSGYLSVPAITSFGGAQGIVLATSLKLYGVQIPTETYVNNGLFKNGDKVFANIPGSGVVEIGTLANVSGAPTVTVTNAVSNLSTFPTIIVSGSGTGAGLAAAATATLSTVAKGTVDSVAVVSSFTVGTLTSTAAAVGGKQVLTFAAGLSVTAQTALQPGMKITLASAGGAGSVGPFVIDDNGINLNNNTNTTITIVNSNVNTTLTTGASIAVTVRGGAFYNSAVPPTVTFTSPPTSVGAVGTATIVGGRLTGIAIATAGSGYQTAPAINITRNTSDTTGSGARATATLNATGGIDSITIDEAGSSYTAVPVITILPPPPAATAQGTATVVGSGAGGVVTLVNVDYAGSGYTTAPTVTFSAPSLGSIVAYANCGLGEVQITSSVTGFAGTASVFTTRPSGPLQNPTQALIIPLKFREITGITGLRNQGVVGSSGASPSSIYYYKSGLFPLIAISAPALSTTAFEAGNDATQLITNEVSNGFTFATPQFQGWYGVNFNVGDTFQFLVKYTIAKAVVFVVDTDVTLPGLTSAASQITIGGVTIPLYNPATGTGVGRELSTNAIVHTYMVTLKAS